MIKKITTILLAATLSLASTQTANAAFIVKPQTVATSRVSPTTTVVADQKMETVEAAPVAEKQIAKGGGSKSKIIAALLAFFLGGLGIHRFYMGQSKVGLLQLGLTVLGMILSIVGVITAASSTATGTFSLPILAIIGYLMTFASGIWALIDFVRILTGSLEPESGFDD